MFTTLTLKRAKELAKEHNGHLPKCGYEFIIYADEFYRLSLVNNSGKYSLLEIFNPFASKYLWQESANKANIL